MKCLSLTQPWASLVILALKRYETRSWQTSHRGPLLIHAGKSFPEAAKDLCHQEPFKSAFASRGITTPMQLPTGVILGVTTLTDCQPTEELLPQLTAPELHFGDFSPGRYAWHLLHPRAFEQVLPFSGRLGVFEVPDMLIQALIPAG